MPLLAALWPALAAILALAVAAWLASLAIGKVSFVDSLWSIFFLVAATAYAFAADGWHVRGLLVAVLLAIWALRLCVHIARRNAGEPEDHRYQAMRASHRPFAVKSLYIVFGLQGVLAWLVSVPLAAPIIKTSPLNFLDAWALLLWIAGMVFEAGGDRQLAHFRADPANRGRVLDTGLWRYTRHPNYFGEFCIWWAFYLFACAAGAWWTILSPLLMTWLLLRVSGVALLERDITDRRPAYRAYQERTNAFFPGPPRETNAATHPGVTGQ